MSLLRPPSASPGPRRRNLLVSGASLVGAALLSACSDDAKGSPHPGDRADLAATRKLGERAARDSAELLRQYDATLSAHPGLEARLRPLRGHVAAHAAAFRGAASPEGAASDGPSRSTGPGAAAGASTGPTASATPPGDEAGALRALATAERRLADRRAKALVAAPGELARLLASVSAAGAAHAYLLTEGGK